MGALPSSCSNLYMVLCNNFNLSNLEMCIYLIRFYHNIYTDTNKWIFLLFYKNEVCMGARTILDDLRVKKSNNSVHGYSCTTDLLATSRSITITQDNPGTVPGYLGTELYCCFDALPWYLYKYSTSVLFRDLAPFSNIFG